MSSGNDDDIHSCSAFMGEYENHAALSLQTPREEVEGGEHGSHVQASCAGYPAISEKYHFEKLGFEALWQLPGHGEPYSDCGQLRYRGCLNVGAHSQEGLIEQHVGKAYIEWYHRSCGRLECPICYEKAAALEAHKIEYRLAAVGRSMGKVIHLIISPPKRLWHTPIEKLRQKAYVIAKEAGFKGGSCIPHPFRPNHCGGWYFSPHFHFLGYGWVRWSKEAFKSLGWVVKNRGLRKSVSATAFYQISHCGVVSEKKQSFNLHTYRAHHSITWFGKLAYNKLKIPKQEQKEHICPICGSKLVALLYVGQSEFESEGEGWFEADDFIYKAMWPGG